MSLPNLPHEILLLIIAELRYANKFGAIAKLCQTCKTVCALVQPELFRQGPQWLNWSDGTTVPPYKVEMVTLMRFIEAVVERPELGTFVRKLDMDILFFPRFDSLQNLPFGPRKVSMETLMRAYNHFPADWKQRHLTGNAGIHPLPLFMLLISLTPNLQELGLSHIETGLGGLELLWERDSQGIRRYDYLPNLKKLVIVLETMSHESLRNLIHLMHLPTLNEFSICGADEHDPGCPPFNLLQPESLSITMLDLGASTFTPPLLRQIVRACKRLKVFCISEAVIDRKCRHASRVKRSNILSILEAHKYSLLKLELNFNDCAPNPGGPDWSHYGSFTSFISLKVLQVEQSGLRDIPGLPNSLESLRIIECDRPVFMFLASLIAKSKSDRLSLKYVRISEKWEWRCKDQNWILGIEPTCELDKTAEGKAAMMEACRRLDNLIKKADFSVEIVDCAAWDRYVAEQKTTNEGVVVDNTA